MAVSRCEVHNKKRDTVRWAGPGAAELPGAFRGVGTWYPGRDTAAFRWAIDCREVRAGSVSALALANFATRPFTDSGPLGDRARGVARRRLGGPPPGPVA